MQSPLILTEADTHHASPLCSYVTMFISFSPDPSDQLLLGTLRSDNGDVHENVAEKQTSHHFKLFRDYPNSSCYLKEGNFGWS